jgi:hypothetical protein
MQRLDRHFESFWAVIVARQKQAPCQLQIQNDQGVTCELCVTVSDYSSFIVAMHQSDARQGLGGAY